MADATLEGASCDNCGADVRENTQFCYNCGNKFAEAAAGTNGVKPAAVSDKTKTALDGLAAKLRSDNAESGDKLALAAAKRKEARVAPKRPAKVAWEADETRSGLFIFLLSLFIFVLTGAAAFVTVYWK